MRYLINLFFLCFLATQVSGKCSSLCSEVCNRFNNFCNSNMQVALLGASCETFTEQCNTTCKKYFCSCMNTGSETCLDVWETCRGTTINDSKTICSLEFSNCVFTSTISCVNGMFQTAKLAMEATFGKYLTEIAKLTSIFQQKDFMNFISLKNMEALKQLVMK